MKAVEERLVLAPSEKDHPHPLLRCPIQALLKEYLPGRDLHTACTLRYLQNPLPRHHAGLWIDPLASIP